MKKIRKLLVIIGSAKAGTSALAYHLSRHPEMFLGKKKEPIFFSRLRDRRWNGSLGKEFASQIVTDLESYFDNFSGIQVNQWAIDASTDYIWSSETPALLNKFSEDCDVRVLAIVRDPIDRAISEYNHTIRHGWEPLSFRESVKAEGIRYEQGWHPLFYHARRSRICDDIRHFHEVFRERFLVIDYADLKNIDCVTKELAAFLGISQDWPPLFAKRNQTYLPRNALAEAILRSDSLRAIGRSVLPSLVRKKVWNNLHTNSRNLQTVLPVERQMFREQISEEIEKCITDPLVPTGSWSCI